ncbi:MAG: hypothetical protein GC154_11270 [bacterium]|nr:hypothetical protein [bacterium]
MRRIFILTLLIPLLAAPLMGQETRDKTVFQTASPWRAEMDIRSDAAIIYGMNDSFMERLQSWKERGYGLQFMTGVAWGGYQDYLNGRFDGKEHHDEGQVERDGRPIMHGRGIPYMVPTPSYIEYMKTLLERAIDAGVSSIYLEEPEFWNRGGYSEGFKQEWLAYYGEDWRPQHESPEAAYHSAKLKYHLYFRALKELFAHAKQYSESKGTRVKCFVPTHTLINYSAWQIVSPESSLSALDGMDGYIAQVWTGTSRTPLIYKGVEKERTFENAYLEYGSMLAMTAPTGRLVYFLTDPIEDNPNHSWDDYKYNYEQTFTAQLMHPEVDHYEVMPWPNRIFFGKHQVEGSDEPQAIPEKYKTEILTLINALNDVPASDSRVSGTRGVGVLLSDTMMFQRFPTFEGYEDPRLSNFYGMALPLLKRGVPVQLAQMENLPYENTLKNLRVLVMSYANMKPLKPEYHQALVNWVKQGGALIYAGRDADPYQGIHEWWSQGDYSYSAPSQHLFELAGVKDGGEPVKTYSVGGGSLTILRLDPKELCAAPDGGEALVNLVRQALDGELEEKNWLLLERGPYDVAAALDESAGETPNVIDGPVIDLYDPELPVLKSKIVHPGERAFVYNLRRNEKPAPCVLAAASRVEEEETGAHAYTATLKGPLKSQGVARLLLKMEPSGVAMHSPEGGAIEFEQEWDAHSNTLLLRYPNHPDGVMLELQF